MGILCKILGPLEKFEIVSKVNKGTKIAFLVDADEN